jgi:hypothetical protein
MKADLRISDKGKNFFVDTPIADIVLHVNVLPLTSRTQPRRASGVNRECGTETANQRWLQ